MKLDMSKKIKELLNKPLILNDKWYVINIEWYNKWYEYVSKDDSKLLWPGTLCNKALFDDNDHNKSLRQDLLMNNDYVLVPEELWSKIKSDFGMKSDKDEIERYVIQEGTSNTSKSLIVEVKLLKVKVTTSLTHETKTLEISKQTRLRDLIGKIKDTFQIVSQKPYKLYFKSDDYNELTEFEANELDTKTVFSAGYTNQDLVYLNFEGDDGSYTEIKSSPKAISSSSTTSTLALSPIKTPSKANTYSNSSYSNRNSDQRAGLCGLTNLGNTCFMNSALQCMSNVPMLSDYFRTDAYISDINKVNPLGTQGELAYAYAELIKEIWCGSNTYTTPRKFKMHLSRFAPQFTGYQQQDSQELLAFLLDGLHEDLNRILNKPYIAAVDDDCKKTDQQLSHETWSNYKKRNDSIIVDIFHGLIKSTLNCLECNKISVKFDPICYLSLPLPTKKEKQIEITYVSLLKDDEDTLHEAAPLIKYKLTVNKLGQIHEMLACLEKYTNVPKTHYVVTDVYSNKFFHVFESSECVSQIKERDEIYVYELPAKLNDLDYIKISFYLKTKSYSSMSGLFGLPLFIQIHRDQFSYKFLYESLMKQLKRFLLNTNDTLDDINSLDLNDNKMKLVLSKTDLTNDNNYTNGQRTNVSYCDEEIDNLRLNAKDLSELKALTVTGEFTQNFQSKLYNTKLSTNECVQLHESCSTKLINKKDQLKLEDCFELYTRKEELSDDDLWYCPTCKKHQHATKQIDLWQLPPVLIIHLKRFSFSRYSRDKIDTHVDFPITNLNLSKFIKCDYECDVTMNGNINNEYNLIGISNHYGGLGGGHYTACAQNRDDGNWYNFDDSCVTEISSSSICTSAAYLLIYLRKDFYNKCMQSSSYNNINTTNGNTNGDHQMDLN